MSVRGVPARGASRPGHLDDLDDFPKQTSLPRLEAREGMKGVGSAVAHWAGKGSRPALLVVAGLGLALGGLVAVGHLTREALRGQERYTLPFTAIDCPPPPGQDRAGFLAEVRYLSEAPEQLHLLDDDLSRRLAAAFARHPRVEKVERVEVLPPRTVRVRLVYRNRP